MMSAGTPPRHAVLFELLRQQHQSELTAERLRETRVVAPLAVDVVVLQRIAALSWAEPRPGASRR